MKYTMSIDVTIETTAKDSAESRKQIQNCVIGATMFYQVVEIFNHNNGATQIIGYAYNNLQPLTEK